MKKFLLSLVFLAGCQTAAPTPKESCVNYCTNSNKAGFLYADKDVCLCATSNGVKDKFGMCAVSTGNVQLCALAALGDCQNKNTQKTNGDFCSEVEEALSGN